MADTFTKEQRSRIMRAVKPRGNKTTELRLIEIFRGSGVTGWRRGYKLFGNPDFVFLKQRVAVFVDGCFWHGHDCRNTKPKTNARFWRKKIEHNIERDKVVTEAITKKGWRVVRVWECELKKLSLPKKLEFILAENVPS